MDDRIRVSDADRERVADRLRDHFAEGRLSSDELDERLTAALSAKTFGDLRTVMADLPEPAPAPLLTRPPVARRRAPYRSPVLLPLVLIGLAAAILVPSLGWIFIAVLKIFLVAWLAAIAAAIVVAARFRRRRRGWPPDHQHSLHQHRQRSNWPGCDWPGSRARQRREGCR
jgi:hypothetical protein